MEKRGIYTFSMGISTKVKCELPCPGFEFCSSNPFLYDDICYWSEKSSNWWKDAKLRQIQILSMPFSSTKTL